MTGELVVWKKDNMTVSSILPCPVPLSPHTPNPAQKEFSITYHPLILHQLSGNWGLVLSQWSKCLTGLPIRLTATARTIGLGCEPTSKLPVLMAVKQTKALTGGGKALKEPCLCPGTLNNPGTTLNWPSLVMGSSILTWAGIGGYGLPHIHPWLQGGCGTNTDPQEFRSCYR